MLAILIGVGVVLLSFGLFIYLHGNQGGASMIVGFMGFLVICISSAVQNNHETKLLQNEQVKSCEVKQ